MGKTIIEEVTDVPLIYPLIEVTYRTVAIVNGRRIDNNCSTLLNMDQMTQVEATKELGLVLEEFEKYVSKVVETVSSEQGQHELQNILDNSAQEKLNAATASPASPDPSPAIDPADHMGSLD